MIFPMIGRVSSFGLHNYNSDGAVAGALPFDSFDGLYDWIGDHPDFCDVNVERVKPYVRAVVPNAKSTLVERVGQ